MAQRSYKRYRNRSRLGMILVLALLMLPVPNVRATTVARPAQQAPAGAAPHASSASHAPALAADAQAPQAPPAAQDFTMAAPQGFGDRNNTRPWSMQWWKGAGESGPGHLYVGTARTFQCVVDSSLSVVGQASYPPSDPDLNCTQSYADLPLQGEVWRWTPPGSNQSATSPGTWDRVYQSPDTIPNPDPTLTTTNYLPPEIGIRGFLSSAMPDGTPVLIASAVSAKALINGAAGATLVPDLLYTTDGTTWHHIPNDPGTTLGNVTGTSYRGLVQIGTRLYTINGNLDGAGSVYAADWNSSCSPLQGDNCWYPITNLNSEQISEIASYNGFLYMATNNTPLGSAVLKADPTQPLTTTWALTTVVPAGAGLTTNFSNASWSMDVYTPATMLNTKTPGWLFVGGAGYTQATGAELLRIDPYDNWDVVHGPIRATPPNPDIPGQQSPLTGPDGEKYPLTGLDSGFDTRFNQQMWRMENNDDPTTGDGQLYVSTLDVSTLQKYNPTLRPKLLPVMGFDLWRTSDGWNFTNVTQKGFGDLFNSGGRTLQSTPFGLFVGADNPYYGLNVYRSTPTQAVLSAPQSLQVDQACGAQPVISWQPGPLFAGEHAPSKYLIYRSQVLTLNQPPLVGVTYAPTNTLIATVLTPTLSYVDSASAGWKSGNTYHYRVVAADDQGNVSAASNMVRWPSLGANITADAQATDHLPEVSLLQATNTWEQQGRFLSGDAYTTTSTQIQTISTDLNTNQVDAALSLLESLSTAVQGGGVLEPLATLDMTTMLGRMIANVTALQTYGSTVCAPPATQTPVPTATQTAVPTDTPTPTQTATGTPPTATGTATATATNSPTPTLPAGIIAGCTAIISTTTAAVVASSWNSHPTITVTGTGFLPNESVQFYFNSAVPFGGPGQGSFPATATADGNGVISGVQMTTLELPAPNPDYAITAQGNAGSCATIQGIIIPTTIGVPINPVVPPVLAPVAAVQAGASVSVSDTVPTMVISSSRIMATWTNLSATIDTASQNNFSAVPAAYVGLLGWTQVTPLSLTVTPLPAQSGPTWGVFQLSGLPAGLSFNVHSIIITGTNQGPPVSNVYIDPVTHIANPYTLATGQAQNDAVGVRYLQVSPAAVTVNPASAAPGTVVTLSGSGFAARSPLTLTFLSGTTVLTPTDNLAVTSSQTGTFSYALTVPAVAADPAATLFVSDVARTVAVTHVAVSGGSVPTATATATATATGGGPVSTALALAAGWTLLSLPLLPSTPLTAQDVLTQCRDHQRGQCGGDSRLAE